MPKRPRLLVFIVAYQAERTVKKVIRRIPASLAADYCALFLWVTDPLLPRAVDLIQALGLQKSKRPEWF